MSPADYSAGDLDSLMGWFAQGEDPLNRGEQALASAIHDGCRDIAERAIGLKLNLRQDAERDMLDDAVAGALEGLWSVLLRARQERNASFLKKGAEAFVRSIAQRALADQFRERKPDGYKLQCAVSYILDRHPEKYGITVRASLLGRKKAYGLADGYGQCEQAQTWERDRFLREMLGPLEPSEIGLSELIHKLLAWYGRDMARDEIMACLRGLLPAQPAIVQSLDVEMEADASAPVAAFEDVTDLRQALVWLWREIEQLPDEQARAVLLRMDSEGIEVIAMEVGYEPIAEKLGISAESLVEMIDDLPLAFERIGKMLGMSSLQARGRRARGWERIERRYRNCRAESGCELSVIGTWVGLLDRERAKGQAAVPS